MSKIVVTDTEQKDEKQKAKDVVQLQQGKKWDTMAQAEKNALLEAVLYSMGVLNKNGKVKGTIKEIK